MRRHLGVDLGGGAPVRAAVIALVVAVFIDSVNAPSMRRQATRLPPSSTTTMSTGKPISAALAAQAAMIASAPACVSRSEGVVNGLTT